MFVDRRGRKEQLLKQSDSSERLNFNKVPTTVFVSRDEAVLDNSLRNLSTKSISVYEALRPALATDHILINCILSPQTVWVTCTPNY